MLRVAVWDIPPAQFLGSRLERESRIEIVSGPAVACEKWLAEDEVDLALISTLSVMRDPEPWELLPDVGLATRRYPYARLFLRDGLGAIERIGIDPRYRQEAIITQIVLKEHYDAAPEFVPYERGSTRQILAKEGGVLVTDPLEDPSTDGVVLDIGREWFELSTYPMVWGVFAALQDKLPIDRAERTQQAIAGVEADREEWISRRDLSEEVADFMREDLFIHLKGHLHGGFEELAQYLFFHGIIEDVPQLPFLIFSDAEEEEAS
jgi:predicted solute-binding protein